MKKIIFAALAIMALSASAKAQGNFDIGVSSVAFSGFRCPTGTASQINATRPAGFTSNISGYRILNQDSAPQSATVWIGGPSVSTTVAVSAGGAGLGYRLAPNESVEIKVGKDYRNLGATVPIYCKAADSAAAGALPGISIIWYGY